MTAKGQLGASADAIRSPGTSGVPFTRTPQLPPNLLVSFVLVFFALLRTCLPAWHLQKLGPELHVILRVLDDLNRCSSPIVLLEGVRSQLVSLVACMSNSCGITSSIGEDPARKQLEKHVRVYDL